MKTTYTDQMLKLVLNGLNERAREDAINTMFSAYWDEFFKNTPSSHAEFLHYKNKSLHLKFKDLSQEPMEKENIIKDITKIMTYVIGKDLKIKFS